MNVESECYYAAKCGLDPSPQKTFLFISVIFTRSLPSQGVLPLLFSNRTFHGWARVSEVFPAWRDSEFVVAFAETVIALVMLNTVILSC
jgi:hypothetical protein